MRPPLSKLDIPVSEHGFYAGISKDVAVGAKLLIMALVVWAVAFPENAASALGSLNTLILGVFNYWYIYAVAFFLILCLVLALLPASGRLRLGRDDERPEFSNFSWFSMMFSAGIGIGMLTFATAEPIYHFQNNPNVILGEVTGTTAEAVRSAYVWSFTHWGLSAWGAYAIAGLAFAYFSYRRDLPLTVRTALIPLFGKALSGRLGHVVDIVAVVAIVLGIAQTLGYGVEQFVAGLARIGLGDWLLVSDGNGGERASFAAILLALFIIVGASTLSALSGVGRGIKWLSNLNMGLSFFLLAFFLVFGSTLFALEVFFVGIWDYLRALPEISFAVWSDDGTEQGAALAGWQGGWTVFYWAWWIAVTPFVGLFLARISRGRTVREFILGAMIIPSIMCFIWFAFIGGTAIDLELNGGANNAILGVGISDQLYATLSVLLGDGLTWVFSVIVVVLLLTYLVTSADSAVLIINTINAAGDDGPKARPHIIFWGIALALVVGALLVVGGLKAIQTAMVIAALPFSFAMMLMGVSLIKAIINDSRRTAAAATAISGEESLTDGI